MRIQVVIGEWPDQFKMSHEFSESKKSERLATIQELQIRERNARVQVLQNESTSFVT